MCEWGDTIKLLVPIPANCSHTGELRWDIKPVDKCLADIVSALNAASLYTGGACCGHGKDKGYISLHDGRVLILDRVDPDSMPCVKRDISG